MIFKQETQILKCTFEKEHFSKVKAAFKDRWPVVYIIEDDEKGQAYICLLYTSPSPRDCS